MALQRIRVDCTKWSVCDKKVVTVQLVKNVDRSKDKDKVCDDNKGVIVTIVATHNCVSCRGVKHQGASMVTTKASGAFRDNNNLARKEFFDSIKIS